MSNNFIARSLCVINDFSIEERVYLFEKVTKLKKAMAANDKKTIDSFRINDPDFGIYEVFLEDSTRTKESFRNAAKFHLTKVSELSASNSSFNKGESFSDTFNTLAGYSNSIFIIRSKVEGVCAHLENKCSQFAQRNNLVRKPSFINAGDGKHEHPTQELLDEYTFLEDNDFCYDEIHIALVGDLLNGRTVHSKANGLKIFKKIKIDLVAPEDLAMPETYINIMKNNGFEVNIFSSIEDYLNSPNIATKWYFTRPQLERMGEQILKRREELTAAITFRKEFINKLPSNTKFYHPLPRHKLTPTIPTFLDKTSLNGWEKQSINGMYVRIILLALIGGALGEDFVSSGTEETEYLDEEYIFKVETSKKIKKKKDYSEGVNPIENGVVIDHICRGDTPKEIREHMALISQVIELDDSRGGEWVSGGSDSKFKGIIFRPGSKNFTRKELKRLAAIAPGCTLNIIKDHNVVEKYRTTMPPRIYNFDNLCCKNEDCISNPTQGEGVEAMFYRTKEQTFICNYCGQAHSFKEIFKSIK